MTRPDRRFRAAFEQGAMDPATFDHRAHLRLAYILLVEHGRDAATNRMRAALTTFLQRHGHGVDRYHETITRAWLSLVAHHMDAGPPADSADAFLSANRALLDRHLLATYYSPARLALPEARRQFVEPDVTPLPP